MKKLLFSLVVMSTLSVSAIACNSANLEAQEGVMKVEDGVHLVSGNGKFGEIQLAISIDNQKFEGMKLISHNDTSNFFSNVFSILEKRLNGVNVKDIYAKIPDTVLIAGSSGTYRGMREAISSIFDKVGDDVIVSNQVWVVSKTFGQMLTSWDSVVISGDNNEIVNKCETAIKPDQGGNNVFAFNIDGKRFRLANDGWYNNNQKLSLRDIWKATSVVGEVEAHNSNCTAI